MKNLFKVFGVIALAAIIGFSFAACGGDGDDPSPGTGPSGGGNMTWAAIPPGTIWDTGSSLVPVAGISGIAYGNSKWVAVGGGGKIATSTHYMDSRSEHSILNLDKCYRLWQRQVCGSWSTRQNGVFIG